MAGPWDLGLNLSSNTRSITKSWETGLRQRLVESGEDERTGERRNHLPHKTTEDLELLKSS